MPICDGDQIARGRGPVAAQADLVARIEAFQRRHGPQSLDALHKLLAIRSPEVVEFICRLQAIEHADGCEVAEAAAPVAQYNDQSRGNGDSVPVPHSTGILVGIRAVLARLTKQPYLAMRVVVRLLTDNPLAVMDAIDRLTDDEKGV